jgi:hypothetical protein
LCHYNIDHLQKKLTTNQEATSEVIEVHEDDPVYFELIFDCLHTHKCNQQIVIKKKSLIGYSVLLPFTVPIAAYELAEKYDVPGLREVTAENFPRLPSKESAGLTTAQATLIPEATTVTVWRRVES